MNGLKLYGKKCGWEWDWDWDWVDIRNHLKKIGTMVALPMSLLVSELVFS